MKILIYGLSLCALAGLLVWLDLDFFAGIAMGVLVGFAAAVDRVYFIATGEKLTGAESEKVYNKVLSRK